MKLLQEKDYIQKLDTKFNGKFDYSNFKYKGVDIPTEVICPVHGAFTTTPYNHYRSKHGCKKCGEEAAALTKQKSTEDFVLKARKVHGDKYDYSNTVYKSAKQKLTITCPDHGDFKQLASGHLSGYGCKYCASHGKGRVDMEKPCYLYYLRLKDFDYYKLGITTQSVQSRYRTNFDKEQFEVVFAKLYNTGREAYELEQQLFLKHSSFIYTGQKLLHSGNTEIFTEDIFKGNYNDFQ